MFLDRKVYKGGKNKDKKEKEGGRVHNLELFEIYALLLDNNYDSNILDIYIQSFHWSYGIGTMAPSIC
jgi:hypothetical protein